MDFSLLSDNLFFLSSNKRNKFNLAYTRKETDKWLDQMIKD